jgi:RNA polymerase sigma-70 factor (TIGR02957 family)
MTEQAHGRSQEDLRPLLFSIAYRMLGTVADAEDIVQEAFLRLQRTTLAGTEVHSPRAFLTTVTTRLAIDQLRSARVQRESYIGPWLPEPVLTADEPDPAEVTEMADSLSMSFLVLLETLSPVERAVFLLREVFDYGYDEIAEIVDRSEANCRQIFVRARKRIDEGKPRFDADRAKQRELTSGFIAAAQAGEVDRLVELLAADVVFYGDGGGNARGLPRPVYGRDRVCRMFAGFYRNFSRFGIEIRPTWINGQPGTLNFDGDGRLLNVFVLDITDGVIHTIRSIINPDKLGHLGYPLSPLARREQRDRD